MCKQSIKNFVCVDCIGTDIREWLPYMHQSGFEKFHGLLTNQFVVDYDDTQGKTKCLQCRKIVKTPICSFCYTNEIFLWLNDRDSRLASVFTNVFDFDFENSGHKEFRGMEGFVPINEPGEFILDEGICEECECFSSELSEKDGKWVCENCKEELYNY